ncbi:hypothetical protein TNCT_188271 [Trichonephila clavata]|uniref:Uncharacterized protein n=1 Tax=Trichonephila clavata TaxID=2740835 RepID=A0A8X6H4M4_TRICU|nr:hypothetical protein TNCT_188271 [Trichonephila clavata]
MTTLQATAFILLGAGKMDETSLVPTIQFDLALAHFFCFRILKRTRHAIGKRCQFIITSNPTAFILLKLPGKMDETSTGPTIQLRYGPTLHSFCFKS